MNSLAQTLVKITAPGVPDFYQGTELWDLSLVDPDNRRPVDWAQRQRLLAELAGGHAGAANDRATPRAGAGENRDDGRVKMYLIREALARSAPADARSSSTETTGRSTCTARGPSTCCAFARVGERRPRR